MIKRLLDELTSKWLKKIMESKEPGKVVEEAEKEICRELNNEEKKQNEKEI